MFFMQYQSIVRLKSQNNSPGKSGSPNSTHLYIYNLLGMVNHTILINMFPFLHQCIEQGIPSTPSGSGGQTVEN